MSAKNDNWTTPPGLFKYLNKIYSFDLDAAASKENSLCRRYISEKQDALKVPWIQKEKGITSVFCNPPYSKAEAFARKALKEVWQVDGVAVLLLPVRSDRFWYQKLVNHSLCTACYITGRLHFGGSGKGAFMYSVIVEIQSVEGEKAITRLPRKWIDASNFNENGKGGARS